MAPTTDAPLLGEPLPVELMNTVWADRDGVYDALAGASGPDAWLRAVAARLPGPSRGSGRLTPEVRDELRDLRDALRTLAAASTGDPRPEASGTGRAHAVRALNRACALAPAWPQLSWPAVAYPAADPRSTLRSNRPPAEVALSAIAAQAVELFGGPLRTELRACLAPGCVLYFVREHPRREWCSAACGNRARVARHYRRHRGTST